MAQEAYPKAQEEKKKDESALEYVTVCLRRPCCVLTPRTLVQNSRIISAHAPVPRHSPIKEQPRTRTETTATFYPPLPHPLPQNPKAGAPPGDETRVRVDKDRGARFFSLLGTRDRKSVV